MILITGLTGTSGRAFYDVLCREKYHKKIRVVVRKTTDISIFKNSPLDIEMVEGDITDVDFLIKSMKDCDTVFHIADKNKSKYIADAIVKSSTIKRVIMVSSTIVYSKCYPNCKLNEIEPEMKKEFDEKGIKYVFLRPTMIFGTIKDHNISEFIRWFKKYPIFPIVNKGKATIQPVSRLDVAEGYWLALKNFDNLQSDEYIISGKDKMTLLEMFNSITELLGKKVIFINVPFGIAKFLVNSLYFFSLKKIDYREKLDRLTEDRAYSHDKIKEELNYEPSSFKERVQPLVEEIKNKK